MASDIHRTTIDGVIESVGLRGENAAVDLGEKVEILKEYVQACNDGTRPEVDKILNMLTLDSGGEYQLVSLFSAHKTNVAVMRRLLCWRSVY